MSDQPLYGAVALVTGASSGVGAATARRLARDGAEVAVAADITSPDLANQAVQDTLDRLGRLDVLVNNAGIMLLDTALHTSVEDWDRMVSLNVTALLHVTHAAVPYLIDAAATSPRQVADLVNVGSTAGRVARPAGSAYHLTMFGLQGFTESLRQELLAERVRVSVVSPGEAPHPEDVADAIGYVVTRDRRVAVNEMVVRTGEQTW
jgi:NADP-dependent 3-hydroxy acid dehydrogenase YdfG